MKKKILLVLSILLGLMFINAGLNKFFNYMPMPEGIPENVMKDMMALMEISWLMPLIAMVEITSGVLFMFNKTRAFGTIIIFPVMIGILLHHIFVAPSGLLIALVLFAILVWTIVENRDKYLLMIK